jgi:ATP-dependent Clp protease ATP-binding subunit ClpA
MSAEDAIYTVGLVEDFVREAKLEILGQDTSIDRFGDVVTGHLLGLRDPTRCLSVLMPGETGLGKTQLMQIFQLFTNLPGLYLDGGDYHSEHSATALFGSPRSYKGSTRGPLFAFAERHRGNGFVFMDELDKAHEGLYGGLTNVVDKGRIPSGTGRTLRCPSMMFFFATNAGADALHPSMSKKEMTQLLGERFKGPDGVPRPEFINRFELIPMFPISRQSFMQVIERRLSEVGDRFGFMRSSLRLAAIHPEAGRIIFDEVKKECEAAEKRRRDGGRMGFGAASPGDLAAAGHDTYFNMRAVGRVVERMSGESLRGIVKEQLKAMAARRAVEATRVLELLPDGAARLKFTDLVVPGAR